jgi:hypothetical protein
MRTGRAERVLEEVAEEFDVDLVVLAWSGDLAPGRARVVRASLGRFPTLLVAVDDAGPARVTSAA